MLALAACAGSGTASTAPDFASQKLKITPEEKKTRRIFRFGCILCHCEDGSVSQVSQAIGEVDVLSKKMFCFLGRFPPQKKTTLYNLEKVFNINIFQYEKITPSFLM